MNFLKMNESAVSPIVATLVLIVVAVVGAVAVGTIMGTFSSDVAGQTNAGDIAGASSAEIITAGSTTVQPASELLAKAYMKKNPSVKITVQGGGSGAGVAAVGNEIVDIGAASRNVKPTELTQFPDLKEYRIGGSAIVWVASNEFTGLGVTEADLKAAWADLDATGKTNAEHGSIPQGVQFYQRSETSGTEETAAEFCGISAKSFDAFNAPGQIGNSGMRSAIEGANVAAIGFLDFGYTNDFDTAKIKTLTIDGMTPNEANVKKGIKALFAGQTSTDYPTGLCRGLYLITNGEPSGIVKNFIQFAQSPEGGEFVNAAGMFGNAALA